MNQTAATILTQLGGNRFCAMTGVQSLVAIHNGLQFRIGRGAINKANTVRVTLQPSDLYSVEFFNLRGVKLTDCGTVDNVYADQLQSTFTAATGMDTKL
jgi:hypothetical protein